MSEALIFGSTNPQYEDRFFFYNSQVQYMKIPSSEQFLYTTCSPYVLQKRRASDKDLPVTRDSLIIICLAWTVILFRLALISSEVLKCIKTVPSVVKFVRDSGSKSGVSSMSYCETYS